MRKAQYITTAAFSSLTDGSFEAVQASVREQLAARGMRLVSTFSDRAVALNDAGEFFECGLDGASISETKRLHVEVIDEGSDAYWLERASVLSRAFLEEALDVATAFETESGRVVARYMARPRLWKVAHESGKEPIRQYLSKSASWSRGGAQAGPAESLGEWKVLSRSALHPVKSLEALHEIVDALGRSVKESLQHLPVGVLSSRGLPSLEESLGAFIEDLWLDLGGLSNMLSALPARVPNPAHVADVSAAVDRYLPLYEEAALFVAEVVGSLSASTY